MPLLRPALLLATLLTWPAASSAQTPVERVAAAVESYLAAQPQRPGDTVRIEVGRILDSPRLEACTAWTATLPRGQRAWGRVSVAVACSAGAKAALYVPASIEVSGPYVVVAHTVRGGEALSEADLRREVGEVSSLASDVLREPAEALGLIARQTLVSNQPLRASQLRAPLAVTAGQTVKLVAQGEGFAVSYEGQALNTAGVGQAVRVRVAGGRIVSGKARGEGVVELDAD